MESLVSHMAEDVWSAVGTIIDEKGIQEIVPKDAQAWEEVRFAAMGLAETGNLLMFETRAKDTGDWMKFAQELVDRSMAAAKAAEAKNPEELLTAGGRLYETCSGCHMKYIPPGEPPRP
ncbi:MAG: cytochrome c [Acidobacteria bacterium]|nr:cytochrome c [Acidobacteriota bacterium]